MHFVAPQLLRRLAILALAAGSFAQMAWATPANKAAFERHFDSFLSANLRACTTCHLPGHAKNPEDLEEIPHNAFGKRLREMRNELSSKDIDVRLAKIAQEDSDGDGVANQLELLLGNNPGDAKDLPSALAQTNAKKVKAEFAAFEKSYKWRPFEALNPPKPPSARNKKWVRNPIDSFIAAEHEQRGLSPRPEAPKAVLLRRVYLDLIGLVPTPEEQLAFEKDKSKEAYEKVVDHLLKDPRYGERWGRHWMDIWRYSDWAGWSGGNQIRDSKPHIWRWRDWIVESLNEDKRYDRMLVEMLAADEIAPTDTNAVRATGFLARNYKMLSREQWLEDTVKHTSQAFLGVTVGCAKCHNHMYDPISQMDYYQMRAVFEPHHVRTDKVPPEIDPAKDGLVRVYDVVTNPPTYLLKRGDERFPDTNRLAAPGVPKGISGARLKAELAVAEVSLPEVIAYPDKRPFVIEGTIAAGEKAIVKAEEALNESRKKEDAAKTKVLELELEIAKAKQSALLAVIEVERTEDTSGRETFNWTELAEKAVQEQRLLAVAETRLALHIAENKEADVTKAHEKAAAKPDAKAALEKAEKELEEAKKKAAEAKANLKQAEKVIQQPLTTSFKPRPMEVYPARSTGRRLAFARWVTDTNNPLTARVAMNHIWLHRFGRGIVNTPTDFGGNGAKPTHPALLDWLAGEFMKQGWSMKAMHRLMVTSSAYRMASTPAHANLAKDPDNLYLWRMPSRRMEAEVVRDNLLWAAGTLDTSMGGPEIPHTDGLTSKRRSLYLRIAAEKEVEFLKLFDGPSVNECYRRSSSVLPQQALAMANSKLALDQARELASTISKAETDDERFVTAAYARMLARKPTKEEMKLCLEFLKQPAESGAKSSRRDNLVLVLFNHNDFVTVR
jgi:hypothetical protein